MRQLGCGNSRRYLRGHVVLETAAWPLLDAERMREVLCISSSGRNEARLALVGVLAGAVVSVACSNSDNPMSGPPQDTYVPAPDTGTQDTTVVDGSNAGSDSAAPLQGDASLGDASDGGEAGPCLGPLAQVASTWGPPGTCPDTGPNDTPLICGSPSSNLRGSCGDLEMFGYSWGTHRLYCFYPHLGGALVGAAANDDVPTFCGGTSYTISAGSVVETESAGGALTWSVSGQTCVMPTPTYFDCTPDASGD